MGNRFDHLNATERLELSGFIEALGLTIEASGLCDRSGEKLREILAGLRDECGRLGVVGRRSDAHRWLRNRGIGISLSQLYRDCAAGILPMQPNKTILLRDLQKYRETLAFSSDLQKGKYILASEVELQRTLELLSIQVRVQAEVARKSVEWLDQAGGDPVSLQEAIAADILEIFQSNREKEEGKNG